VMLTDFTSGIDTTLFGLRIGNDHFTRKTKFMSTPCAHPRLYRYPYGHPYVPAK